jgi:hypothetical protein
MNDAAMRPVAKLGFIAGGALALALMSLIIAYEYTGDFTGIASFDTRGRHPASATNHPGATQLSPRTALD